MRLKKKSTYKSYILQGEEKKLIQVKRDKPNLGLMFAYLESSAKLDSSFTGFIIVYGFISFRHNKNSIILIFSCNLYNNIKR